MLCMLKMHVPIHYELLFGVQKWSLVEELLCSAAVCARLCAPCWGASETASATRNWGPARRGGQEQGLKSHPSRGCGAKLPRDPGASEGRGRIWGQPRYCSSHKKLLAVWHEGLGCPSAFPISVPSALLFQPILQAEALGRFLWSCCGSAGPCA